MAETRDPENWHYRWVRQLYEAQPQRAMTLASLLELQDELFHYTTADGLKGIVEQNCIWATAAAYLNDASEIEYGCTLLDEVLAEWEKTNVDNNGTGMWVIRQLRSMFKDEKSRLSRTATIYVAC